MVAGVRPVARVRPAAGVRPAAEVVDFPAADDPERHKKVVKFSC